MSVLVAAEWVFWTCLILVGYTYFFYPCVLFLAYSVAQIRRDLYYLAGRGNRRCAAMSPEDLPAVSLVIPAYNEQAHLPAKLENIRRLDYPKDKLEVVFVSDGSTDRTDEILASFEHPGVRLIRQAEREGKPTALNRGVAEARHDLLIFSDASTLFAPDSLRRLARHFSDPTVGAVCGRLAFEGGSEHQQTEGIYWKYETALRLMEARLGATLTASGAMYAMRRQAFLPLAADVMIEDFVTSMNARKLGYRVLYDPEAVATEFAPDSVVDEYTRRVRIAAGSFKALRELLRVPLNPMTYLAFVSHKLLRWSLPFLMLGLLISNALLWSSPFYRAILFAQFLFYALAGVGYLFRSQSPPARYAPYARYAKMGYFLCAMNLAYLVGFVRFLTNRGEVKWQRVP